MKNVKIKYNPYVVETEITVDGQKPKANSALNVGKKRLQEWVEKLPQIILDEYRDSNVTVDFTGTVSDYEDIESSFNAYKDKISPTCNFHKTADITDVEKTIDKIFDEIKNGPVAELKDKKIIHAFEKAKDSKFEVNVVATMSSGKSTLINALLGQQLMPAANEATTATIVKIIDTDQDNFSAVAYDKSGQAVKRLDNVTLEDMQALNADIKVSTVEIKGKIPCVSSVGMKLVLVDTPGPNNSRDKRHEEMTYKMIADSDKSLVLYVMNGQQLGINDEKIFLDYVCQSMKDGGKKARERFIFAVNKMDAFSPDPQDDGPKCITNALENVKSGLEDREIYNPNIFPVCSLPALQKRAEMKGPRARALNDFKMMCEYYDVMHFEKYYEYNNLPQTVRNRLDSWMSQANSDDDKLEVRTGIVSIEQAIAQYINKYARTTKVYDLVHSFNEKLNELAAVAHLEDAIRKDKDAKAKIEEQIAKIKANIQSAQNAQKRSKAIDNIDLTSTIEKQVATYMTEIKNKLSKMMSGRSNKVEKIKAKQQCEELEKECKAISVQIKVQIDIILETAYKDTITKIVEDYKRYLAELNIGVDTSALSFNPANLVSGSLSDLSSIIDDNTETVDESYYDDKYKWVPSKKKWYNPFSWFNEGAHWEGKTIEKYVDYFDMNEVASDYIVPFQKSLDNTKRDAINHVKSETQRLKEYLKSELAKIDKVLNQKLDALSKTEADNKAKAEEIAVKEKNLKWLESIQSQVNNIINF
jgi:hypothetical protein